MKQQKGITLIALIITIIVMLILVAVTLSIVLGDNGILNKARTGTKSQALEQERETLQAAVLGAYDEVNMKVNFEKLDKDLPSGFEGENGTYTSTSTGNVFTVDENGTITATAGSSTGNGNNTTSEVPDELVDYLLGADHQGRDFTEICDIDEEEFVFTFKTDANLDFDATKVTQNDGGFEITFWSDSEENVGAKEVMYCEYEGKIYRYLLTVINEGEKLYTEPFDEDTTIEVAFEPDDTSRIGKHVLWDSNDNGTDEEWIILYDDSTNGLQIISANVMKYNNKYLHIGYNDEYLNENDDVFAAMANNTSEEQGKRAEYSYNKAIETLNSVCNDIITNRTNVAGVRCVGSNPTNPSSESGYFTSTRIDLGEYNGKEKAEDMNGLTDYDRMIGLEIFKIGGEYWLASRIVCEYQDEDLVDFDLRHVWCGGDASGGGILYVDISRSYGGCDNFSYLRPVVTLNSNVTFSGAGTETDPYTF